MIGPTLVSASSAGINRLHFAGATPKPVSSRNFGHVKVDIKPGDITKLDCDAYIVPEFQQYHHSTGVGRAIYRAGAVSGINAYDPWFKQFYETQGSVPPIGEAFLVSSGGGRSKNLIHVVSVDTGVPITAVENSMYKALLEAKKANLHFIAAPALCTGDYDDLSNADSAKAMLKGIKKFAAETNYPITVTLVPKNEAYGPAFMQELAQA